MSNTKYRFDKKILSFFIFVIILAIGTLVYKYYNTKRCPEIVFTISNTNAEVGELIEFNNRSKDTESIKWDFGDNSVQVNEASPTHTYLKPGEYVLKLTINGACEEMRKIIVKPKRIPLNEDLVAKFECADNVTVGKPIRFACISKNCTSWEWRFGETGKVDSREKNPIYIYKTPGAKTVSLVINGKYMYIAKHVVYVTSPEVKPVAKPLPKPKTGKPSPVIAQSPDDFGGYDALKNAVPKEPEKPKIMSNDDVTAAIISYSKGKTKISQFAPSCCGSVESLTVEANGKLMSFKEFLDKILWQNVSIKELKTLRDNGCINQIILKYKKN
jgi:PKD repeat protein